MTQMDKEYIEKEVLPPQIHDILMDILAPYG